MPLSQSFANEIVTSSIPSLRKQETLSDNLTLENKSRMQTETVMNIDQRQIFFA